MAIHGLSNGDREKAKTGQGTKVPVTVVRRESTAGDHKNAHCAVPTSTRYRSGSGEMDYSAGRSGEESLGSCSSHGLKARKPTKQHEAETSN